MTYAAQTTVPIERSKAEIEAAYTSGKVPPMLGYDGEGA